MATRPRVRRTTFLLPLALLLAACSDVNGPGGEVPVVQLSAPTAGAVVSDDSVAITGVANDDHMVVRITTQVTQGASGAEVDVPIAMARALAFSGVVHDLPIGDFTLTVRAYDAEGRAGQQTVALRRPGLALYKGR